MVLNRRREPLSAVQQWKFDQQTYQTIHLLLQLIYGQRAWNKEVLKGGVVKEKLRTIALQFECSWFTAGGGKKLKWAIFCFSGVVSKRPREVSPLLRARSQASQRTNERNKRRREQWVHLRPTVSRNVCLRNEQSQWHFIRLSKHFYVSAIVCSTLLHWFSHVAFQRSFTTPACFFGSRFNSSCFIPLSSVKRCFFTKRLHHQTWVVSYSRIGVVVSLFGSVLCWAYVCGFTLLLFFIIDSPIVSFIKRLNTHCPLQHRMTYRYPLIAINREFLFTVNPSEVQN